MKSLNIAGRVGSLARWFVVLAIPLGTAHAPCTRCCSDCPRPAPADILYSFAGQPDGADASTQKWWATRFS